MSFVPLGTFLVSHTAMAPIGPFLRRFTLALFICATSIISFPTNARAENLITQPGAHNNYKWELEPQLVLRTHTPYYGYGGRWGWPLFSVGANFQF